MIVCLETDVFPIFFEEDGTVEDVCSTGGEFDSSDTHTSISSAVLFKGIRFTGEIFAIQ
jgi:hypothetical protein